MSQWEFDYGLFTNLPRIIVARDFSRVHSNWKELSYLFWQNTYANLKTTWHVKLKKVLWTKLLENLLLAKYVAAPINLSCDKDCDMDCDKSFFKLAIKGFFHIL